MDIVLPLLPGNPFPGVCSQELLKQLPA